MALLLAPFQKPSQGEAGFQLGNSIANRRTDIDVFNAGQVQERVQFDQSKVEYEQNLAFDKLQHADDVRIRERSLAETERANRAGEKNDRNNTILSGIQTGVQVFSKIDDIFFKTGRQEKAAEKAEKRAEEAAKKSEGRAQARKEKNDEASDRRKKEAEGRAEDRKVAQEKRDKQTQIDQEKRTQAIKEKNDKAYDERKIDAEKRADQRKLDAEKRAEEMTKNAETRAEKDKIEAEKRAEISKIESEKRAELTQIDQEKRDKQTQIDQEERGQVNRQEDNEADDERELGNIQKKSDLLTKIEIDRANDPNVIAAKEAEAKRKLQNDVDEIEAKGNANAKLDKKKAKQKAKQTANQKIRIEAEKAEAMMRGEIIGGSEKQAVRIKAIHTKGLEIVQNTDDLEAELDTLRGKKDDSSRLRKAQIRTKIRRNNLNIIKMAEDMGRIQAEKVVAQRKVIANNVGVYKSDEYAPIRLDMSRDFEPIIGQDDETGEDVVIGYKMTESGLRKSQDPNFQIEYDMIGTEHHPNMQMRNERIGGMIRDSVENGWAGSIGSRSGAPRMGIGETPQSSGVGNSERARIKQQGKVTPSRGASPSPQPPPTSPSLPWNPNVRGIPNPRAKTEAR